MLTQNHSIFNEKLRGKREVNIRQTWSRGRQIPYHSPKVLEINAN